MNRLFIILFKNQVQRLQLNFQVLQTWSQSLCVQTCFVGNIESGVCNYGGVWCSCVCTCVCVCVGGGGGGYVRDVCPEPSYGCMGMKKVCIVCQ